MSIINFNLSAVSSLPAGLRPRLVLGLGVFDGVHLGHQRIIRAVAELAAERGARPAAVTFDPHPRAVLCPDDPPRLLLPLARRLELLRAAGAELTGVISFSPAFAALEPEEFLNGLLHADDFELAGICVGSEWRFGRFGRGNRFVLRDFADRHSIGFTAVPELELDGGKVGSTAIRHAIAAGRLESARAMLGRAPELFGEVVSGYRLAGRELDAPTANLQVDFGVLPPDGVYAGAVRFDGVRRPAALNLGIAPTFGYDEPVRRLEVHVIDYSGDLYGRRIEVELLRFLRVEVKFPSAENLRLQIIQDVAAARQEFGRIRQ